ncbi:hypothetical protein DFH09DRAFT_432837 [Mycena vulgaris]|nr:hypothetical protein DFH09DRAFT_432837 [Mycena vulgaris]
MSTSTALVPANVLGELKLQLDPRADERWMQLTRGSLSDPATGRTLHQVYSRLAHTCAVRANRAAHRRGWGPSAAAARIEAFFGMGMEREEKLEALRVAACPGLEGKCSRLLRYALPRETAKTQVQAFKNILTIVTRYPGTQALFLKSKHLGHGRNTEAAVSALWTRADDTHTRDWDFYCGLAAVCLSDTDISSILGNLPPRFLGCTSAESGALGVLERLLIVAECSESAASTALAQRYLTGILEMPTFWRESGLIHSMVFTKILARLSCVLNDLGLDSAGDEDNQAVPIDNMFDTEGIDAMTSAILTGVLGWPTATDPKSQYWYRGLAEVVQLLRRQEAESLLPRSWELADGPGLRTIISDPDAGETMTVLMMPCVRRAIL